MDKHLQILCRRSADEYANGGERKLLPYLGRGGVFIPQIGCWYGALTHYDLPCQMFLGDTDEDAATHLWNLGFRFVGEKLTGGWGHYRTDTPAFIKLKTGHRNIKLDGVFINETETKTWLRNKYKLTHKATSLMARTILKSNTPIMNDMIAMLSQLGDYKNDLPWYIAPEKGKCAFRNVASWKLMPNTYLVMSVNSDSSDNEWMLISTQTDEKTISYDKTHFITKEIYTEPYFPLDYIVEQVNAGEDTNLCEKKYPLLFTITEQIRNRRQQQ